MSLFRPKYHDTSKKLKDVPPHTHQYQNGVCEVCHVELKQSKVWWYSFTYARTLIEESTGTKNRTLAEQIEIKRRHSLEHEGAGIRKPAPPKMFFVAAEEYLKQKEEDVRRGHFSPSSLAIETLCLSHLLPVLGKRLLIDIEGKDFSEYQENRLKEPLRPRGKKHQTIVTGRLTSPSSVNLELSTFRAIMKRNGQWDRIQKDIKAEKVSDDVGIALTQHEEQALLQACSMSRSHCLYPFIVLSLETGARYNVIRNLQWCHVDFNKREVKFGKDKTKAGTDRKVPLSPRAHATLKFWSEKFPNRKPTDFVFPHQRYGGGGRKDHFGFTSGMTYDLDVTRPLSDLKEAFDRAKLRAAQILKNDPTCTQPLTCRFHDLRHTAITRMVGSGIPLLKIAAIVGWSKSTTVLMASRYSHFTTDDLREGVDSISKPLPKKEQEQTPSTLPRAN
jgi:integrase